MTKTLSTAVTSGVIWPCGYIQLDGRAYLFIIFTSSCLTDIKNTLPHNVDKGQLTGMVFLDLSIAFNTLDRNKLLDTLTLLGLLLSLLYNGLRRILLIDRKLLLLMVYYVAHNLFFFSVNRRVYLRAPAVMIVALCNIYRTL